MARLQTAIRNAGLAVRGGFHPRDGDGVPTCNDRRPAATVVLVGNVGTALWPAFAASPEFGDGMAHPLDRWTRRVTSLLAGHVGATGVYPFDGPPHFPFQRWAQRADDVHPSPLGLLVHPEHGLWHAYRAALLFAERIELPERSERAEPLCRVSRAALLGRLPRQRIQREFVRQFVLLTPHRLAPGVWLHGRRLPGTAWLSNRRSERLCA